MLCNIITFEESLRGFTRGERKNFAQRREFKEDNHVGYERLRQIRQKLIEERHRFLIERRKLLESRRRLIRARRRLQEEKRKLAEKRRELAKLKRYIQKKREEERASDYWLGLVDHLSDHVLPLFERLGISLNSTSQLTQGCGEEKFEFDLIASSEDCIVVVEVRITFELGDLKHFLEKLAKYKTWMPYSANSNVYGAIAFVNENPEAEAFAQDFGLFTIHTTGDETTITNPTRFQPRVY